MRIVLLPLRGMLLRPCCFKLTKIPPKLLLSGTPTWLPHLCHLNLRYSLQVKKSANLLRLENSGGQLANHTLADTMKCCVPHSTVIRVQYKNHCAIISSTASRYCNKLKYHSSHNSTYQITS